MVNMDSSCQQSPVASSEHDSDSLQVETNADEEKGLLKEAEERSVSSTSQTRSPIVSASVSHDDFSIELTHKNVEKEDSTHVDEKKASHIDMPVRWLHFL